MMRPRCSILTGGFDFSGCGDFTSCPPVERAAMSNSEPSAIVLHAIPCIGGLYGKTVAVGTPSYPRLIPRYRQYHRPIVCLADFWSDRVVLSDSIGLRATRNKGEES